MSNLFDILNFKLDQTQGEGLANNETKETGAKNVGKDSNKGGNLPSSPATTSSGGSRSAVERERKSSHEGTPFPAHRDGDGGQPDEPESVEIPELGNLRAFTIPKKKKVKKGELRVAILCLSPDLNVNNLQNCRTDPEY